MRKHYLLLGALILLVISTSWILLPRATDVATNTDVKASIPDDVNAIFETSCMACHSAGGKGMAMSMVDFSKWDNYTPEKQAKKAAKICNAVTKGSTPPKSFRESNPDAVLTDVQKEKICKWSVTLTAK